jgi:hypothetical protein
MALFLTMGIEASIVGNAASERNLVWCVSRPKPPREPYLALGETVTYQLFFFLLGLVAFFFLFLFLALHTL